MFLPKYPLKSVTQHPAQVFVALGMHLDSLLQKLLMQTRPFQHFLFPLLAEVLWCKPLLCLSWTQLPLISNNIPEPQAGENRHQWSTHAWDHTRRAGRPYLSL